MAEQWRPTGSINNLKKRAAIIRAIRQFFYDRDVLEVETPQLCRHSVTDPHLQSFETNYVGPGEAAGQMLYLQTSPEFAMKRLLCADSGPIFQLCKAYRNEERGRLHNPEFTMLEWYQPGFDHFDLMDEVQALVSGVLDCASAVRMTYQQACQQVLQIDPLGDSEERLTETAGRHGLADIAAHLPDRDSLLQLLFSHCVETQFDPDNLTFVYDFPASQAALAQVSANDPRVAHRFELYVGGVELANGFFELTDAVEQKVRFDRDNQRRRSLNRPEIRPDPDLIDALKVGLKPTSGVALGVDRLIMLAIGATCLADVLTFDISNA